MEIAIYILGLVVISQAAERYFYSKEMMRQLDNAHKLNNSKTAQDYISLKAADTIKPQEFQKSDEIPIEEASDEQFINAIKQ